MYKSLLFLFLVYANSTYANIEEIINQLQPFFPSINAEQINESQIDGFYEVIITEPRIEVMYISSDARYVLQGTVTDLVTMSNLSEIRINATRKQILDNIDENSKIVFKAVNEQYIVHVFTDVDCPYCAKLHNNMAEMNSLGITIKYLASPLEQLHPQAQSVMEKIWCAENRNLAIHNYKTNRILPVSEDCENPVAQQLAISEQLGVYSTPSIFLEDGTNIPGYKEPKELLQNIKQTLAQ